MDQEEHNWYAKQRNRWMMIASVSSVIFVFGLPGFQKWNPYYFNPGNSTAGSGEDASITISGYISKAPATGLMAMMFFTPIMQMWLVPKPQSCLVHDPYGNNLYVRNISSWMKIAAVMCLGLFQVFFGAFLAIPNIYNPSLHGIVVALFAVFGLLYFLFQIYFLRLHIKKCEAEECSNNHSWERFQIPLFFLSIGCLGLIMLVYAVVSNGFYWGFWFWECIALSGMAMFAPTLMLEFHDTKQSKTFVFVLKFLVEPLYYDVFGKGCRNSMRVFLTSIPTVYILSLPWLSGEGYAASGGVDNVSIENYLSGMTPIIPGETIKGGSTGAAIGLMVAVMFFPILTLWNVKPKADWEWSNQKLFFLFQLSFTMLFFAHFASTLETTQHHNVYIAMIVSAMLYFLLRFKATKHQCINWITFLWNFGSCIALLVMEYQIRNKNYKFKETLFMAETSFYFSIIWTIPFEIINNCNIPFYKIINLFKGLHSDEVNEGQSNALIPNYGIKV